MGLCTTITTLKRTTIQKRWSTKKKAQQCENASLRGIKRCKQTHQCAEYFSQMKPRQSYQSMGSLAADKPLQLERSLPYCRVYGALFCETRKIHLLCTAGHPASVWAHSQAVSTGTVYKDACIISERKWIRFSQVSHCWKDEHTAYPSPSMVPAAASPQPLTNCTPSLLKQVPLRVSCCICIGRSTFEPTFMVAHPESNLQKDVMASKESPIVYYKVTGDWPAASQTLRPEKRGLLLLVVSIILSTLANGAEDVSLCVLASIEFYWKQVRNIHGLSSDKHWREEEVSR